MQAKKTSAETVCDNSNLRMIIPVILTSNTFEHPETEAHTLRLFWEGWMCLVEGVRTFAPGESQVSVYECRDCSTYQRRQMVITPQVLALRTHESLVHQHTNYYTINI